MKNDIDAVIDAILDDLLALWYRMSRGGGGMGAGYATASPMFRDTKSAWSPYDRDNGVPDEESDRSRARAIGIALFRVPNDAPSFWRTLLMNEAHNLEVGLAVFHSPRLPAGEEYEIARIEARTKLLVELQREGCVGL